MPVSQVITCPGCGNAVQTYRNPALTVDVIIDYGGAVVLVHRKNPPAGWALPGGFVDYGETVEHAAIREAREETNLELVDLRQFAVYSDPRRDERMHIVSVVFTARGLGDLRAGDDAASVRAFSLDDLPALAFDHERILGDYRAFRQGAFEGLAKR